jgi:molybdenum cofactor cytidylyltransferase
VRESGLHCHVVRPDMLPEGGTQSGMGDSIAAGVAATAGAPGWLILPADLPLIRATTLRQIAFMTGHAVVVPVFRGQRGHPVRFAADCGPELTNLKGNQGAAQLIRARAAIDSVAFVDVEDEGCVTDVDTLDDLRRAEALLAQR